MSNVYDQISTHNFAIVPRSDVPRSRFNMRHSHKFDFDAGYLIPVYCEELLPGDHFKGVMHAIARLATPITPFMDDLTLESFFFFVPDRLVWANFPKFMGEQTNPGDSISYVMPTMECPAGGYAVKSLQDYFGLPTAGQITGSNKYSHVSLPLRAYNLIYNEWFRDQNLINSAVVDLGDGPDTYTNYVLRRRGKRHDYITSCLPWAQKGSPVSLSLGTSAPVSISGRVTELYNAASGGTSAGQLRRMAQTVDVAAVPTGFEALIGRGANITPDLDDVQSANQATQQRWIDAAGLTGVADLSTATAQTINAIRSAFQIQRFLEKDARGGTRYIELILNHFGVRSPDARQQRPEHIGGGSTPVVINAVAQTSSTDGTSPQGTLTATGTMITTGGHRFQYSATEHGYIIGIINVRGENTYQQGLRRMWSRSTRYDLAWPVFAHLGEQAVYNKELYCTGTSTDNDVFGYQERYGEYRFHQSLISGNMRSTAATTLHKWHLAQQFGALPTLNQTFIEENPPVSRVSAVSTLESSHFVFDSLFEVTAVRPLPMYGVPGLIDHF